MSNKRILSFILSMLMIGSCFPNSAALAETDKRQRTAYLHAQGENPSETTDVSTVYKDETADIYLAIDNPNKGLYENGEHKEPQYDLNGYTVTIYFDPEYFDYADASNLTPIDYTVPDKNASTSPTVPDGKVDVPTDVGYYPYQQGKGEENGYKKAYVTVLYNGGFVPQKQDDPTKEDYQLWYNLCKLPLKPIKAGSTQVFIDTSDEQGKGLEFFAKNKSEKLEEQTFPYTAVNGGYHTVIIKDKSRPAAPNAIPPAGSYDRKQSVTLSAESGCDIYYSTDGGVTFEKYTSPIEVETTMTITCYAKRITDGKKSNTVSFEYKILPKAPLLFNEAKTAIPNIYTQDDIFTVYAWDKETFSGTLDDENKIYYTFSNASADNIIPGSDPETQWVELNRRNTGIEITKQRTVRLITDRMGAFSDVSEYHLGIKPAKVTASHASGTYNEKIDVILSTKTTGAKIFYTTDGTDPVSKGIEYAGAITLAKDTTLRAVAHYDGIYSEVSSFHYVFRGADDYGIDAFYPPGVYEGSVNVTLTANNPENRIEYSADGGATWLPYTKTLIVDKDTDILARAVDKDDNRGGVYSFKYKIKPLPPHFAPESTQFTNADNISVYCVESNADTTGRFDLYYTTDGSDPISNGIKADDASDSATIQITKYTVVKAVVLKDGVSYSSVVTHSYDIVNKKPSRPLMTLNPGKYIRKIGDEAGFSTQFMPVPTGTEIYYTVSYDGKFVSDPIPNTADTIKYDGQPITVKGHTIIKAVAVNVFGIKSDIGIFEYIVAPEAPKAAPPAVVGGGTLPVVPVSTVKGSTVKYEINGFKNEFVCTDENFYIDTQTGSAYKNKDCTVPLGTENTGKLTAPAVLNISAALDGIESEQNSYTYDLSSDINALAPPYADKETGEYEEIKADSDNNLLHIGLYSLNSGDTIQYKTDNGSAWNDYNANDFIKIKDDTILQIRSAKNGKYSTAVSYVYHFVPLAPIITLPSGRYLKSEGRTTQIKYDGRAPEDKIENDYKIMYRENGDKRDYPYTSEREIDHTMSFKAYVVNNKTGRLSKNTIHYYIIEPESAVTGSVYIATPYDVPRISADVLSEGEYAKGIKLLTGKNDAVINYCYTYTQTDSSDSITTANLVYDNTPITVNSAMTGISITAWLTDKAGNEIAGSKETFPIEFVHLNVPQTSLGSDKVEFSKGTEYTIINDYPNDEDILLYYTLDGSDPADENNQARKLYSGEKLVLNEAVTVKAVYLSACGTCKECKSDNPSACWYRVYGKTGMYRYTVPTVIRSGGGGGGRRVVDNTRKYTKDIFGNEHPTHIGYINGYPNGSVKPDGKITREEMTAVLYRIENHEYEKPFAVSGDVFPDVDAERWSAHDIEYMSEKGVVNGYPDGEFKPSGNLTRAEFAALISRFAKLEKTDKENPFPDLDKSHWAYEDILRLSASGLMQGYEDGTYRTENNITRAEVMTVINKILGRNPSEEYVKSLDFNPFNDLERDKWHYVAVLEATITHNYYLDNDGLEIKWEDCK